MRYRRLVTCTISDLSWCFVGSVTHDSSSWLARGEPIEDQYPDDPFEVNIPLDPDVRGVRLPDLIGNTRGLLILSAKAREAFATAELDLGAIETRAFSLVSHEGRVHSKDYAFVNPLGGHDIAHPDSVFQRYERSQDVYGCTGWVLDGFKLEGKPDLLRAQEVRKHYFVSERLVDVVRRRGLTNFEFLEVDHVGAL